MIFKSIGHIKYIQTHNDDELFWYENPANLLILKYVINFWPESNKNISNKYLKQIKDFRYLGRELSCNYEYILEEEVEASNLMVRLLSYGVFNKLHSVDTVNSVLPY